MKTTIDISHEEIKRLAEEAGILVSKDENIRALQHYLTECFARLSTLETHALRAVNRHNDQNAYTLEQRLNHLYDYATKCTDFHRINAGNIRELLED